MLIIQKIGYKINTKNKNGISILDYILKREDLLSLRISIENSILFSHCEKSFTYFIFFSENLKMLHLNNLN